jgi:hypothetical protein
MRRANQLAVKADLQAVMNATTLPQARSAARRLADDWEADYPKVVRCRRDDLDELLTCWRHKPLVERKKSQDYKCPRAALSRSPAMNPANGRLLRPHFDGPHLVRRLQPRKPQLGRPHPLSG